MSDAAGQNGMGEVKLPPPDEVRRLQLARLESIASASGAIGHKLNNLLAGLLGYVTLLRKALDTDGNLESASRYLDALDVTGSRVNELTRRLMTIAQKDTVTVRNIVDITALIGELPDRAPEGVELSVGSVEDGLAVSGQAEELGAAILQLAVGPAQILPGNGAVEIDGCTYIVSDSESAAFGVRPGRHVFIRALHKHEAVADTALERLFDPYYTIQGKGRGAELMLTEAWGTIQLHGGTVLIDHSTPEVTRLILLLPMDRES